MSTDPDAGNIEEGDILKKFVSETTIYSDPFNSKVRITYIEGATGMGKTHLLRAMDVDRNNKGELAWFINLGDFRYTGVKHPDRALVKAEIYTKVVERLKSTYMSLFSTRIKNGWKKIKENLPKHISVLLDIVKSAILPASTPSAVMNFISNRGTSQQKEFSDVLTDFFDKMDVSKLDLAKFLENIAQIFDVPHITLLFDEVSKFAAERKSAEMQNTEWEVLDILGSLQRDRVQIVIACYPSFHESFTQWQRDMRERKIFLSQHVKDFYLSFKKQRVEYKNFLDFLVSKHWDRKFDTRLIEAVMFYSLYNPRLAVDILKNYIESSSIQKKRASASQTKTHVGVDLLRTHLWNQAKQRWGSLNDEDRKLFLKLAGLAGKQSHLMKRVEIEGGSLDTLLSTVNKQEFYDKDDSESLLYEIDEGKYLLNARMLGYILARGSDDAKSKPPWDGEIITPTSHAILEERSRSKERANVSPKKTTINGVRLTLFPEWDN